MMDSSKNSKTMINLISINSKKGLSASHSLKIPNNDEERFQSFDSFRDSAEKRLTLSNRLSRQNTVEQRNRGSTQISNFSKSLKNKSFSQDISKKGVETHHLSGITEHEHSDILSDYRASNGVETDYLPLPKSDLTNRLIDLLKDHYWAIPLSFLWTLIDSLLRINTLTYFFYRLLWISRYYYVYLTFVCVCRGVYGGVLIKLLFQSEFDDIYLERIGKNFALNDEGPNILFWNRTIQYDFEFNLDTQRRKKQEVVKRSKVKTVNWGKTLRMIGIRVFMIVFPTEINFVAAKIIYYETQLSFFINVLCAWFLKSVEIYLIIPFFVMFFYFEEWHVGLNYDFISLVILGVDVGKTLFTIIILFMIHKRRTRSKTLFFLASK